MRVLFRISGILVVTAALLTWILLAMGWTDLFNLPGFESARSPTTESGNPDPKTAQPRSAETAPVQQPSRVGIAEVTPPVARPETARPELLALPGPQKPPAEKSVAAAPPVEAPVERVTPTPAPAVVPVPEKITPPVVVSEPVRRSPEPVAVPVEPKRAPVEAAPAPSVTSSTKALPASTPTPAPVVQPAEVVKSPPAKRLVEMAPVPSAPAAPRVAVDAQPPPAAAQPKPQPQPEQRVAAPASAPASGPAKSQKWVATRRIAGYGPDALLDHLDDPRRANDDLPCVVFDRVQFKVGTAAPTRAVSAELDLMAKSLGAVPNGRVEIGSRIGTTRMTSANQRLAAERARFVRDGLVARGIPAERLWMDTRAAYHELVGDDLGRMGIRVALAPSVGLCVVAAIV